MLKSSTSYEADARFLKSGIVNEAINLVHSHGNYLYFLIHGSFYLAFTYFKKLNMCPAYWLKHNTDHTKNELLRMKRQHNLSLRFTVPATMQNNDNGKINYQTDLYVGKNVEKRLISNINIYMLNMA